MELDTRMSDHRSLLFQKRPTNYQPNVFTESRQEFTELEKKIVVLVVNQIGHMSLRGEIKPGTNLIFHVPFGELTKKNHSVIADAAVTLQSKRLIYRNDKTQQLDVITPFPRVRFDTIDGKKVIEITMFSDVVPHFAELGQRYTKYECDVMLSLSSVYAQRMFDIVSMYQCRGQMQFSYQVDRLMEMLNCPEAYTFNDFRRNALLVAQRELQETANIYLDWSPAKKDGKRIIELLFTIKTNHQFAAEGVEQDRQAISQMPIHEAVQTAWRLMANYKLKNWQKDLVISDRNLLETFYRVHTELTNGLRPSVKNQTAYLVKSLGLDQVKSPAASAIKQLTLDPSTPAIGRTATPQSIGSILSIMNSTNE